MATFDLIRANRIEIVQSYEQLTGPAGEALTAGQLVRRDTTTGKWVKAQATTAANAKAYGMVTRTVIANEGVTVLKKGIVDGFDLAALAFDADVFLSDTLGAMGTAAGTVSNLIGRVIPGFGTSVGVAADKLLELDFSGSVS